MRPFGHDIKKQKVNDKQYWREDLEDARHASFSGLQKHHTKSHPWLPRSSELANSQPSFFQHSCINPTELLWRNFPLKTDYLQGCGATIVFPVPALPVECSDVPVPICSLQEAPEVWGHLVNGNLMRTCLCNALLRRDLSSRSFLTSILQEFVLPLTSKMFQCSCSRGIFHFELGKCDWPLLNTHPVLGRPKSSVAFQQLLNQDWLTVT